MALVFLNIIRYTQIYSQHSRNFFLPDTIFTSPVCRVASGDYFILSCTKYCDKQKAVAGKFLYMYIQLSLFYMCLNTNIYMYLCLIFHVIADVVVVLFL